MEFSTIGYENLEVIPYDFISLLELKVENKINEHGRLYLKGVVSKENKDTYINDTETQIEINHVSQEVSIPVFVGRVVDIKIQCVRDVYYMEVEALTNTYELDLAYKRVSFQNKEKAYRDIVNGIMSNYKGGDFIDTVLNGTKIEKLIVQYDETDWEFLKRIASRFNEGLIVDSCAKGPRFWFGLPKGKNAGNLSHFNYSVSKDISSFRLLKENHKKDFLEKEFVSYEIETDKILNIGDSVNFNGQNLIIYETQLYFKESSLKCIYKLKGKKGIAQNSLYNNKIIGLSIQGEVIEVLKDKVKLHLEIDEKQSKSEAWEFTYSTPYTATGHAGWYCMPEVGDSVFAYFPDNKEESAYASLSIRKDNSSENKLNDPNVKYFRTPSGKELKFSDKEILITAKDGEVYIKLNESNGIELYSSKGIKVNSSGDIKISANNKVIISAQDKLTVTCKESSIKMDGETVISGNDVKLN